MYCPVDLAAGGMMLWSRRFHDEILTLAPRSRASSPRYRPHYHTATATEMGATSGFNPISP